MEIYIFRRDRSLLGAVEAFEYLRWTRRYSHCGSFELKAIATPENTELLRLGHYLWNMAGDLSECVEQLMNNHLIASKDPARHIPGIIFSSPTLDVPIRTQTSHRNLLDVATGLCDASEVGLKTVFDPNGGPLHVCLYLGGVTQAVFSKEYENVIDQVYTTSLLDYANTALIGGEGEGSERIFVDIAGDSGEGPHFGNLPQ